MARRTGRPKDQLPTCYYEGYLEKRSFKDKKSRRLWACLCGNTLFFFNEKRDADYQEKLDLSGFISITDDLSQDHHLDAARLNLQMKDEHIKLTASNAEARELWKGFIYSVAQLSVPSSLNLLPGQFHMLTEAIEMEKQRKKTTSAPDVSESSAYVTVQEDMPACYHNVSRLEAQLLLEREAKNGNLLLRPGSNGSTFAVSTRQDYDGSIFKHYRVTRRPKGGFKIDVEDPVHCNTLHDVIDYLVKNTDGVLIPLVLEAPYEKRISFIRSDQESGETSIQEAPSKVLLPIVPPKPVTLKTATPEPVSAVDESFYLNDMPDEEEKDTQHSSAVPQEEKKPPRIAMMPPTAPSRKVLPTTPSPSNPSFTNRDVRMKDSLELTISELKLKLGKKAMSLERSLVD